MKIISIKYKHGKSIDNNHSEATPFSVVYKLNNIISKTTFILVHQYNDNYPYYVKQSMSNYEYNVYNFMEEMYGYSEIDFLSKLKDKLSAYSYEKQEYHRIRPVIYEFIKSEIKKLQL